MKKLLAIILSVLCLSSCAKGVNTAKRKDKDENIRLTNSDLVYDAPANISTDYDDIKKKSFEHLIFDKELNINKCDTVQKLKFSPEGNFLFDEEEQLLEFLNGEPLDINNIETGKNDIGEYHQLNASGGHPYFTLYDNGTAVWIKNSYSEKHFLPTDDISQEHIFLENGYDDKEYKLVDCSMTISEAIEICSEFTDTLYEKYGFPQIYPNELNIQKIGKYYSFEFQLSQKINNAPVKAVHCGFGVSTSSMNDFYSGVLENINSNPKGYSVLICSSDGVECFRNNDNVIKVFSAENLDKIVTLGSALNYIDNNLSSNAKYEVGYIGLENKIYRYEPDTKVFLSEPMWTVSLFNPDEEKWYYALVDCETGDFSFFGQ
ncbi:MAG: hypothetical protein ACI4JW_07060 [Oscillospiraceae bacterium]